MPQNVAAMRSRALLAFLEQSLTGSMRRTYQHALGQIRNGINTDQLEQLLASNDISGALELVAKASGPARETLRSGFRDALAKSGLETMRREKPSVLKMPNVTFGAMSTRNAQALKRLELQFFPLVFKENEKALRRVFANGLNRGINPRQLAVEAKQYVGLTAYDVDIIDSFQDALAQGRFSDVLNRTLRDGRFDSMLKAARDGKRQLTTAEMAQMTTRYRERLHSWRAETWTRTATINAAREGQFASWESMADDPALTEAGLVAYKTWHTTMDGRERPAHAAADGTEVPLKENFPVDGGVKTPGQGVYNCRCTFTVSFREPVDAKGLRIPPRPDEIGLTDEEVQKKRKRERAIARKLKKKDVPPPPPPPPPPPVVLPPPPPPPVTPPPNPVDPIALKREARRARAAARRAKRRGQSTNPLPPTRNDPPPVTRRTDDELVRGAREAIRADMPPGLRAVQDELTALQVEGNQLKAEMAKHSIGSLGEAIARDKYQALMQRQYKLWAELANFQTTSTAETRRRALMKYMREAMEEEAISLGTTAEKASPFNFRGFEYLSKPTQRAFRARMDEAQEFLSSVFPKFANRSPINVSIGTMPDGRAFARAGNIFMSTRNGTRTWVHELAHVIETHFPKSYDWGVRMRSLRATSNVTRTLPGYGKNELFLPGRFFDPYVGKVYQRSHTEVLSMALEELFVDPNDLLRKDPELFDELIKALRDIRRPRI